MDVGSVFPGPGPPAGFWDRALLLLELLVDGDAGVTGAVLRRSTLRATPGTDRYTPRGEAERFACVQCSGRLGNVVVVGGGGQRQQQHLLLGTCPPTWSAESDLSWDPVGCASPGPAGGQQDLQNFLLRAAASSWVGSAPAPGCSLGMGKYPLFLST